MGNETTQIPAISSRFFSFLIKHRVHFAWSVWLQQWTVETLSICRKWSAVTQSAGLRCLLSSEILPAPAVCVGQAGGRGWVQIRPDTPCQARSEHKGRSGMLPLRCIHTLTLQLTGQCQSMPEIYGNYYLHSPRKGNGLTQPGYKTKSCLRNIYIPPPPLKCALQFPPACLCGSEAARGAERLSLSLFFKANRINRLPVWPSRSLCTTRLLCLVVDLMLLTSIF